MEITDIKRKPFIAVKIDATNFYAICLLRKMKINSIPQLYSQLAIKQYVKDCYSIRGCSKKVGLYHINLKRSRQDKVSHWIEAFVNARKWIENNKYFF